MYFTYKTLQVICTEDAVMLEAGRGRRIKKRARQEKKVFLIATTLIYL